MFSDVTRDFLEKNGMGVLTTFRRNGGAQMSVVTCGLYQGTMAFTAEGHRAKVLNLTRNHRCSLLISQRDWWGYLVLEGEARILDNSTTNPEELRLALQDIYKAAAHKDHPDWEEYDKAMKRERRVGIIVAPQKIYGSVL